MRRTSLIFNGFIVSLLIVLTTSPINLNSSTSLPVVPVIPPDTVIQRKVIQKVTTTHVIVYVTESPSTTTSETVVTPPTPTPTPKPTPTPTPTPKPKPLINGSFLGDVINVSYGNMQVKITVQDSKIVDAQAVQYPNNGKSGPLNVAAIATLRQETLAAQSASIKAVSGASFTSYGWYASLISALNKSGL